ncbi:alpha-humulene synthase-like [Musa acuminata AAA Group]|uniref:alpha-humulene synthase-like n=1 Tax=Musa acuminata AAA Group TaxID=214697 RepID=UPI0031DF0A52
MGSLSLQSLVPDDELMVRKSVSYRPNVWGDYFIQHGQSVTPTSEECETTIKERVAELKEQIRSMSKDPTDILQTMNLVDSIQLLGLDYCFEKEISEALNHIYDAHIDDHGLYDPALRFGLLRQQGYYVSPDKIWTLLAPFTQSNLAILYLHVSKT